LKLQKFSKLWKKRQETFGKLEKLAASSEKLDNLPVSPEKLEKLVPKTKSLQETFYLLATSIKVVFEIIGPMSNLDLPFFVYFTLHRYSPAVAFVA
jgi:hypothetical protein